MRLAIGSSRMVFTLAAIVAATLQTQAQTTQTAYPTMAPIDQYMMADRDAEIALARTAAPKSISDDAEVMVLGKNGYEIAVPGTNEFLCMVARSWSAAIGDPVFWNPKNRSPICFNAAAARTYVPIIFMKTQLALAGKSQAQIGAAIETAFKEKKLPALEPGAMCYMMSKQGYLNDQVLNWHPHLMFFEPIAMAKTWGANLDGSPVLASDDVADRLTVFMIPVARWSDGTADARAGHY
ncbi:MAG TPA: hypothetical protein VMD92_18010 [Acidobacteriaceae bacterium]|nr:hypothetical protein [Acidobacteriaceae bacterium]